MKTFKIWCILLGLLSGFLLKAEDIPKLEAALQTAEGKERATLLNKLFIEWYYQDPEKALQYTLQALDQSRESEDIRGEANSENNIGIYFLDRGDFAFAKEHLSRSLELRNKLDDSKGLSDTYTNLGMLFYYQNLFEMALEHYTRAFNEDRKEGDSLRIGSTLNNIGNCWKSLRQPDSAFFYLKLALAFKSGSPEQQASTYYSLAEVMTLQKQYIQAQQYYEKAAFIYLSEDNLYGLSETWLGLAQLFYETGKQPQAIEQGEKAFKMAKKILAPELEQRASKLLSDTWKALNRPEKALPYLELYSQLHDSLLNAENIARSSGLEAALQLKQQAGELDLLKKQNEIELEQTRQKSLLFWATVGCLFLTLLLLLILTNRNRIKNKLLESIQKSHKEIEEKNKLIHHQHAQITSSIQYARNLQDAVLQEANAAKEFGWKLAIINQPKDIVSGDFYWFSQFENQRILVVADGTGHGVPGAFMSLLGLTLVKEVIRHYPDKGPDFWLEKMDEDLRSWLKQENEQNLDGIDMAVLVCDPYRNKVLFAGAQRPLVRIRRGKVEVWKGNPRPIGGMGRRDRPFVCLTLDYEPHDRFVLYTDGVTDFYGGPKKRKLGTPGFLEWLQNTIDDQPGGQVLQLENLLFNWQGNVRQVDDLLLVCAEPLP